MLFYPLVCTVVFFMPIAIGVLGRLAFPDLVGKEADRILPLVLTLISGDVMAALVMAAGLAALMSTMDSQLLTLSSIFTRDVVPLVRRARRGDSLTGRLFVICLSLAGLALAYKPPATILQIATQTFTGLAVLFPTVIFGLYFKRVFAGAALASILAGEALVLLFYLKVLSPGPFLPVVWVMAAAFGAYLLTHAALALRQGAASLGIPRWITSPPALMLGATFCLAMDFWAWETVTPLVLGVPWWIAYFVGLSALQTGVMLYLVRDPLRP